MKKGENRGEKRRKESQNIIERWYENTYTLYLAAINSTCSYSFELLSLRQYI
jgi:hypothetical protein